MNAQGMDRITLQAADVQVIVLPADGGRLGSVAIAGREILVTDSSAGPMSWGAYPMAPWAGRTRDGRFFFAGREHRLPQSMPPHAIHGVVYDRPWSVVGPASIAIDLDRRWPFRGRVTQEFRVDEGSLEVSMTIEADEPMPAVLGWHPWFRRELSGGTQAVGLTFEAATMLARDPGGLSTGRRIAPTPGPWDDAFTDVLTGPVLEWPGQLRLELSSTCPWWVVYSEPAHAICVEPQSGPPDALNLGAPTIGPGAPLNHVMRWTWSHL